mgnify:CR=1 FL=1
MRVVVVTGAGKHFSAGADLNYMKSMRGAGHDANVADALRTQRLFAGLAELPKPVVARVHGAVARRRARARRRRGCRGRSRTARALRSPRFGSASFRRMISPFVIARLGAARARRLLPDGRDVRRGAGARPGASSTTRGA